MYALDFHYTPYHGAHMASLSHKHGLVKDHFFFSHVNERVVVITRLQPLCLHDTCSTMIAMMHL